MNDLRKRIIEEIPDEDETMSTSTLADAVLAVVTAHMTVTTQDVIDATTDFIQTDDRDSPVRAALEAFVASKLKAERK